MSVKQSRLPERTRSSVWSRWPDWIGYATAVWSGAYGLLGLFWALGGGGFPFGVEHDPHAERTLLEHAEPVLTGTVIAAVGLVGSAVAVVMSRRRVESWRGPLRAFAWILAVGLAVVIPDYRPLIAVVRAPMLLIGAPFGFPEQISLSEFFPLFLPWPVANQIVLILGGLFWAATAIAYRRRVDDACLRCGRSQAGLSHAGHSRWTTPESAARWGGWATAVAIAVPVFYAATRVAWKLGIPLGLSPEGLVSLKGEGDGILWAGTMLAAMALGGAVLTLGLVQKWGEVYPRWLPRLRGRPVRPRTAIIPASLVAILITQAGLMNIGMLVNGYVSIQSDNWGLFLPGKLFPLWGVGLGAAALAYHLRRRGQCGTCGLT